MNILQQTLVSHLKNNSNIVPITTSAITVGPTVNSTIQNLTIWRPAQFQYQTRDEKQYDELAKQFNEMKAHYVRLEQKLESNNRRPRYQGAYQTNNLQGITCYKCN